MLGGGWQGRMCVGVVRQEVRGRSEDTGMLIVRNRRIGKALTHDR